MPSKLHKSFSDYFSKMKKKPLVSIPYKNLSSSGSWILRGCRHPRTSSFAASAADGGGGGEVTLADVDRFLFENFKSVFLSDSENSHQFGVVASSALGSSSSGLLLAADVASSSTGGATTLDQLFRSGDDDEEEEDEDYDGDRSEVSGEENSSGVEDFITVLRYSSAPYDEFRRSMQEMMEARLNHGGKIDWGFMEELLLCYLNLNDKKSYKFVLSAFVDLIAVYGVGSGGVPAKPRDAGSAEGRGKEKRDIT